MCASHSAKTLSSLDKAATYAFGTAWAVSPERLDLIFETFGQVPLSSGAERAMPIEVLVGMKLYLLGNSFFTFGVSRGLMGQIGDPDARGFMGIVFEPTAGDRDGDGFNDDEDECPYRAEDKDGYEDGDGCPDEDNDLDRIVDLLDQCPNVPEDKNGYEDEDGCPDGNRDRDRDGIQDRLIAVPTSPKIVMGFKTAMDVLTSIMIAMALRTEKTGVLRCRKISMALKMMTGVPT